MTVRSRTVQPLVSEGMELAFRFGEFATIPVGGNWAPVRLGALWDWGPVQGGAPSKPEWNTAQKSQVPAKEPPTQGHLRTGSAKPALHLPDHLVQLGLRVPMGSCPGGIQQFLYNWPATGCGTPKFLHTLSGGGTTPEPKV